MRRSARLLAKRTVSNEDKASASAPTPKLVVTDGQSKVTGNTTVEPLMLDDGLAIIENNNEGDISGGQIHFIFNNTINSDPSEPTSVDKAFSGTDSKWCKLSSIS